MPLGGALGLLREGYEFLLNQRRTGPAADVVQLRLAGRPAVALAGPQLASVFYDDSRFTRLGALPMFVQDTLFGRGAVHTLVGSEHRERKALLVDVLHQRQPADLLDGVATHWDNAVAVWAEAGTVQLHAASAEVLFTAVCDWLGVPLRNGDASEKSAWMRQMVDGFMPTGPRHLRARSARRQAERWVGDLIDRSRRGALEAGPRWDAIALHTDGTGQYLDKKIASVELLNIIRPFTAISWFVTFAGHALHTRPDLRAPLAEPAQATAFVHELRRYYPFAPFLGAKSALDQEVNGVPIPKGRLTLLDIYGQHHDPRWWPNPHQFDPERFLRKPFGPFDVIAQGGGDIHTGHRCPGEDLTVGALEIIVRRLAALDYTVPSQDLKISLRRVPALPRDGMLLTAVKPRGPS